MESSNKPVVVRQMPEKMSLRQAREFLKEVQSCLNSERPQVVFDLSQVRHIDAAGVDVLLQCMRAVMKRDGDLKLAAPSPQAAVMLELTRTGRLFEIYENSDAAVRSFSYFLPDAMTHLDRGNRDGSVLAFEPHTGNAAEDGSEGDSLAA
jgi:anti-sigma B factor antagonist